jgi:branched-subunit amino acid aminotransferase/4-amino-4-deoxychorismate lyase
VVRVSVLIETVRVVGGGAPLWSLHLDRLRRSGDVLGVPIPPLEPPVGGGDRVVRYEIDLYGVRVEEVTLPETQPLALVTSPATHRGYPHKIKHRGWLDAARTSVGLLGGDDALMLDDQGRVVEATIWAIGWWDGEELYFPPLELGGLPSVARARLGETVRGRLLTAPLRREELAWRSLLACNAVRGVVPVNSLDGEAVPGNIRTTAVASRFWRRTAA